MKKKTIVITPKDYQDMLGHGDGGFCLACGEVAWNVEPDAVGYDCVSCGEPEVMGVENALLEGYVDLAGHERKPNKSVKPKTRVWPGTSPMCDLCKRVQTKTIIDGKTRSGWANMCKSCHKKHGMGLGLGLGQVFTVGE